MSSHAQLIPTTAGRLSVRLLGSGPPAVLWHSMFVDSRTWDRVIPALARERQLIVIDGPSFGGSDPLTRLSSIQECATLATEVLGHLQVTAVDWVGNAWGGHVGIALGAQRPDLVRTLCSIGAPTHALGGMERVQVVTLRPVVRALGFPSFVTKILTSALLSDRVRAEDPDAVRIVTDGFQSAGRRAMDLALRSFVLDRPDLSAAARLLTMPVVFAAGDDRGEWTPAQATAMTAAMPQATAVPLPGVRGIAPLEAPEAVARLCRDFWARTAAPS